jgi:transcriptional regulator with XRE-family HTH domain
MHNNPFPQRLRALLKQRGVTQKKLASAIGVTRAAVSKWFRGSVPMSGQIYRLAMLLDCPLTYLLEGVPQRSVSGTNLDKLLITPEAVPSDQLVSAARVHGLASEDALKRLLDKSLNYKQIWKRSADGRAMEINTVKLTKAEKAAQMGVDNVTLLGNISPVSEIQRLMDRVKRAAAARGKRAELARELNVAPPRISQWLAGEKEPGGEYTLKLLRWVEQQEQN